VKKPVVVALAFLLLTPVDAQVAPVAEVMLVDPQQEAKARELMHELRCLQCQNQSIADSNAPQAESMRQLVRERIAAGDEPDEVRDWFIERYGDWVTFAPPARPETLMLWAAPILLLLVGGWAAMRVFRR